MSNIVNLADHLQANADAENRARRAETVRAKANEGCTLNSADQERIAENLYRLLDRLEKDKRVRRAELCRDVLCSPPEESTKRLRFYALDPAKEGDKRQRQLNVLTKKATDYVRLAEEAARRAGEDVDAVLLDLVHGTALARLGSLPTEDPLTKDLKGPLIRHIERAASRVASKTGLQRAFQMIARYPAKDDYLGDGVVAGPINETLQYLEDGSSSPPRGADRRNWWRLVQSAPSAFLGEHILDQRKGEPQLRSLFVKGQVEIDAQHPYGRMKFWDDVEPREGEHWSADTEYRVQVWLALLPFGPSHEPRLGLRLELLRRVRIERTRAHERQGFDDGPVREEMLSKRIYNLQESAVWSSCTEDLRVTAPIDLAPFDSRLDQLLGRELYQDEDRPGRVLAFGSDGAQHMLNLSDCRTISDWVGPLPDGPYNGLYSGGIRPGPEPVVNDRSDEERWRDWQCARQEAEDRDRVFRFRFADHNGEGPKEERYPMSWKTGTLGYKLERSLLEVDGDEGVIQQLRAQAMDLVVAVQNRIDAALSAREERLVRLHQQSPGDSS